MHAIVIATAPIKEYDRRVTVLSPERGLEDYLVRSVRKGTSKNNAALQPGNSVIALTAKGKRGDYITSAQLRVAFPIHLSYEVNRALQALLRLIKLVATNEPSQQTFVYLDQTLQLLATTKETSVVDQFLAWFFMEAGFFPNIEEDQDQTIAIAGNTGINAANTPEARVTIQAQAATQLHDFFAQTALMSSVHPVFAQKDIHQLIYWTAKCHVDSHVIDWCR